LKKIQKGCEDFAPTMAVITQKSMCGVNCLGITTRTRSGVSDGDDRCRCW